MALNTLSGWVHGTLPRYCRAKKLVRVGPVHTGHDPVDRYHVRPLHAVPHSPQPALPRPRLVAPAR